MNVGKREEPREKLASLNNVFKNSDYRILKDLKDYTYVYKKEYSQGRLVLQGRQGPG